MGTIRIKCIKCGATPKDRTKKFVADYLCFDCQTTNIMSKEKTKESSEWEDVFDISCGVGMPEGHKAEVKSFIKTLLATESKTYRSFGGGEERRIRF